MIVYACMCEEGLGVAHNHVEAQVVCRNKITSMEFKMPQSNLDLNGGDFGDHIELLDTEPPSVRIWVNWKDVARGLSS